MLISECRPALSTVPQTPIRNYPPPKRALVDLVLIPRLPQGSPSVPSTPTPKHRLVTPTSSPALSHVSTPYSPEKSVPRNVVKGSPAKAGPDKLKSRRRGIFTLLCTSLDFGDCKLFLPGMQSMYSPYIT